MRTLILRSGVLMLLLSAVALAPAGNAQQRRVQTAPPPLYGSGSSASMVPWSPLPKELSSAEAQSDDSFEVTRRKELQKSLDKERNREIQKETDQLLELAADLKKRVDASVAGDTLSVDAIKKTDQIESLAKKVRNKMKETYNQAPTMDKFDASVSGRPK